jgi:hypothetical protein
VLIRRVIERTQNRMAAARSNQQTFVPCVIRSDDGSSLEPDIFTSISDLG